MNVSVTSAPGQPGATLAFRMTMAWLAASGLALIVALAPIASAFADGHYVPIGPDSFYHARRILDAVAQPGSFYQFDSNMHAPEGSLVIWPWAYDYVMSLFVRVGVALNLGSSPLAVLMHLPVVAFPLALALVSALCRLLRLSTIPTALALFATAAFPLNQGLYSVGNIDHHFAEHLFVLASLVAGLAWLRKPESMVRALVAGAVLGAAPGVHTALFILQLPLLAALGVAWLRGISPPPTTLAFAISLVATTLAIALPSLSLREGNFQFYTLSWFQVYAAASTAICAVLLQRLPLSRRNVLILAAFALLVLVPVASQLMMASDFFAVAIEGMDDISEVQSPVSMSLQPGGVLDMASQYSFLFVLAPAAFVFCAWRLWRERAPERMHFWAASLFGIALLAMQLRLQYFGSFALALPWLVLIDERVRGHATQALNAWLVTCVLLAGAYAPGFTNHLFTQRVVSGDPYYDVNREIYPPLAAECARTPGVVLANSYDGHYLRFHTDCQVIANNFLVTRQHEQKLLETRSLMMLRAQDLPQQAPHVRYVYVRRSSLFGADATGALVLMPRGNPDRPDMPLVEELLTTAPDQLPARLRLVAQAGLDAAPFARVFAIEPEAAAP